MEKTAMKILAEARSAAACASLLVAVAGCGSDGAKKQKSDAGSDVASDAGGDGSDAGGHHGDGDGDGDNSDGGEQEDAETCGASPFEADLVPTNVLLVIDKSGSMNETPSGFSTDKWTSLTGALESALTAVQDDLSFGIDLYPMGAEACEVPAGSTITASVGQGATHVEQIINKLEGTTPLGATPTAAALARALTYYTDGDGAALEGNKYVLLATDGGPNCNDTLSCDIDRCTVNMEKPGACGGNCCTGYEGANLYCLDDADTLGAVQALASAGIPTVVVGIPGSEAFASLLDSLAVAGGMPSDGATDYYAVTADGSGAGGLVDVLTRVTRQLIRTCDLQLGSVPPDLNKLNVEVDGTTIPRDAPDGWELDTTTNPPTVRLKGATCTRVETDGASSVSVTFGCPTVVVL